MIFTPPNIGQDELGLIDACERATRAAEAIINEPMRWATQLPATALARPFPSLAEPENRCVQSEDISVAAEAVAPGASADTEASHGYAQAMTYALQLADSEPFEYTNQLLQAAHFMILRHDLARRPAKWRRGWIAIRHTDDNEVVYEGPAPAAVPSLMDELIDSLRSPHDVHPVIHALMAHLNLAMIHPFADGNGRIADWLETLVLSRSGLQPSPPLLMERYFDRKREGYEDVLIEVGQGSWQPQRDARPWIRFALERRVHEAETLLERARRVRQTWHRLENEVQRHQLPPRMAIALADALAGAVMTPARYAQLLDTSEKLAERDLRMLVECELLMSLGGDAAVGSTVAGRSVRKLRERLQHPLSQPVPVTRRRLG